MRAHDRRATVDAPSPDGPPAAPISLTLGGAIAPVHDPAIIEVDGIYMLFGTGTGISMRTSVDLMNWSLNGPVFAQKPAWITTTDPARPNDLWAPDVSKFGGTYHLYYSASRFGVNTSCIGHATSANPTTNAWTDHGAIHLLDRQRHVQRDRSGRVRRRERRPVARVRQLLERPQADPAHRGGRPLRHECSPCPCREQRGRGAVHRLPRRLTTTCSSRPACAAVASRARTSPVGPLRRCPGPYVDARVSRCSPVAAPSSSRVASAGRAPVTTRSSPRDG